MTENTDAPAPPLVMRCSCCLFRLVVCIDLPGEDLPAAEQTRCLTRNALDATQRADWRWLARPTGTTDPGSGRVLFYPVCARCAPKVDKLRAGESAPWRGFFPGLADTVGAVGAETWDDTEAGNTALDGFLRNSAIMFPCSAKTTRRVRFVPGLSRTVIVPCPACWPLHDDAVLDDKGSSRGGWVPAVGEIPAPDPAAAAPFRTVDLLCPTHGGDLLQRMVAHMNGACSGDERSDPDAEWEFRQLVARQRAARPLPDAVPLPDWVVLVRVKGKPLG